MTEQYYKNFIDFFIKHNLYDEEIFKYIYENSTRFDYRDDDLIPFIGCYYICNKQQKLEKIKLYVPYIKNHITTLINIHEYIHAIELYEKLGKTFKQNDLSETLPMLYEKIYIMENPCEELKTHITYLNKKINESNSNIYKIALVLQDELLNYYNTENPDFKTLQTKAKKLTRNKQRNKI